MCIHVYTSSQITQCLWDHSSSLVSKRRKLTGSSSHPVGHGSPRSEDSWSEDSWSGWGETSLWGGAADWSLVSQSLSRKYLFINNSNVFPVREIHFTQIQWDGILFTIVHLLTPHQLMHTVCVCGPLEVLLLWVRWYHTMTSSITVKVLIPQHEYPLISDDSLHDTSEAPRGVKTRSIRGPTIVSSTI